MVCLGLLASLVVACIPAEEEEPVTLDGADEPFLGAGGKADTSGFIDGTAHADGLLFLANTADRATLHDRIGLPKMVVDNLLAFRVGDDGVALTADDRQFDSLVTLDAVPFLGPRAFERLATFFDANEVSTVTSFDQAHAYTLTWSTSGQTITPDRFLPELGALRVQILKSATGVQLSLVGNAGAWVTFTGPIMKNQVFTALDRSELDVLTEAQVEITFKYRDRFCGKLTGKVDVGGGAIPFEYGFTATSTSAVGTAPLVCP